MPQSKTTEHKKAPLPIMMLGALGVVFGDIGTSPLYAVKETILAIQHHGGHDLVDMYGLLSILFWLLMIIVSFKYVSMVLYADNKGEGGTFSMLALNIKLTAHRPWLHYGIGLLGILGGCLFYSDAVITPAISVLSAVEGVNVYYDGLRPFVIPATLTVIILLFCIQRFGTGRVGALFGPITLVWFLSIAAFGLISILKTPAILLALNPYYAFAFIEHNPLMAFFACGAIVLAITGAEALYADMGHFGRRPIQFSWILVCSCLMLNYFGQGALVLRAPEITTADNFNPFYMLVPEHMMIPMVILAAMATTIASQATISGAFSLTRQAIQLGYLPRMRIVHTSKSEMGQIYMPFVNWAMLTAVIFVVALFQTSSGLAWAYGIAVVGTMLLTTISLSIVMLRKWHWPVFVVVGFVIFFGGIEAVLLLANLLKVFSGGWLPLLTATILFTFLTTWYSGQRILYHTMSEKAQHVRDFVEHLVKENYRRVPGTAVYMTPRKHLVPEPLLMNLRHNKVLHEKIVLLTISVVNEPTLSEGERIEIHELSHDFFRIILRYGYMEEPNLERTLATCTFHGGQIIGPETSFILGREMIVPTPGTGMAIWREHLYAWMKRNAGSAVDFYRVPASKVIEIGGQYEI